MPLTGCTTRRRVESFHGRTSRPRAQVRAARAITFWRCVLREAKNIARRRARKTCGARTARATLHLFTILTAMASATAFAACPWAATKVIRCLFSAGTALCRGCAAQWPRSKLVNCRSHGVRRSMMRHVSNVLEQHELCARERRRQDPRVDLG